MKLPRLNPGGFSYERKAPEMIASRNLLSDSAERPLRLRVRRDLIGTQQTYQGRNYWVVKDPLTLSFYRFEVEEYTILQLLDGRRSPKEIQRQFERQFAPQRLSLSELQALVGRLFRSSLVIADGEAQGEQLLERHRRQQSQQRHATWSNILCIRFAGVNPDRFLHRLNQSFGWLFRWPGALAAMFLIGSALLLVMAQFDVFLHRLPDFGTFFGGGNWLLLALVLAGTKVLHELGHGLACKRFGGECHELGLMLLILTPCLYCNVSDSWMVRNKWQRAAIGAAGMYVEVILASICTFLWWFSDVGLLHYVCLDIMFVCSVSTLLFNANPLLRYDGYFILADVLEIPNLRQKAGAVVQRKLGAWFLGLPEPADSFLPQRRRWLFMVYAVAASIYRWIVVFSILWFLYQIFAPHGLKIVGQLLVIFALYGLVFVPVWQLIRFLSVPGRTRQLKKLRMATTMALLAGLLAAATLFPLPHYVTCDFQVQVRDAATAYVDVAGTLVEISVQPGQYVEAGQTLVVLQNRDVDGAIARLCGQREVLAARLAALQLQAYDGEAALLEMSEVSESIASLDRRIRRRRQDLARLTIRAPQAGMVFAMPAVEPSEHSETLAYWSGHPLQQKNLEAFLREGVPVCQIGDVHQLEAVLAVDESTIESVRTDQLVELFPRQLRGRRLRGHITQISQTDLPLTAAHFSNETVTASSPKARGPRSFRSIAKTYQASVPLDLREQLLLSGGHGRAKIHAGTRTLGQRVWATLCHTFHFEL